MSEYKVYWLTGFPIIIYCAPRNNYGDLSQKKQTNKYKEIFVILQSIGIIVMKSKETRVITYTCRYVAFNPNNSVMPRIKCPLEYLQV